MKLNADQRIGMVLVGLVLAWICVFMMAQDIYEGLQATIVAGVHGGTYPLAFLQGQTVGLWWGFRFASCVLLAIGLVAEKKETSTGT